MDFRSDQAIYLQIADFIIEMILTGKWPEDEKIPSIRDLAVEIEVNPNTVMRTYNQLQADGIIYNRRGIGYFVGEQARENARAIKKQEFINSDLPRLFKTMHLIDLSLDDLELLYRQYSENSN